MVEQRGRRTGLRCRQMIALLLVAGLLGGLWSLPGAAVQAQAAQAIGGLPPAVYALSEDATYAATASGVYRADSAGRWQTAGLIGISVYALASYAAGRTLYAAADGGVYATMDGGAHWQHALVLRGRAIWLGLSIRAQRPTLMAATDGGIYVQQSGGEWQNSLVGKQIVAAVLDEGSRLVYVASGSTLWRGSIDGTDWQPLTAPGGTINAMIQGRSLYAASSRGLYRSSDGGTTWQTLIKDVRCTFVGLRDLDTSLRIYAEAGGSLQVSSDDGATWQVLAAVPAGSYHLLIRDPGSTSGSYLLAGDAGLFSLAEDRLSLVNLNAAAASHLAYGISRNSTGNAQPYLFAARADFVYRSTNAGASWQAAAAGLRGDVRDLAISNGGKLLAATSVGLYLSDDSGGNWQRSDDVACALTSLTQHPTVAATLYAACTLGGLYRSTDSGGSWQPLTSNLPAAAARLTVDPTAPQVIYAALDYAPPLWRSVDGGANWRSVSSSLPAGLKVAALTVRGQVAPPALALKVAEPSPVTVYLAARGALYASADAGSNWQAIALPTALRGKLLYDLRLLASDDLYLASSGGLFASSDGGVSWLTISSQPTVALAANVNASSVTVYGAGAANTAISIYLATRPQATTSPQTSLPTDRAEPQAGAIYFKETGHNLSGNFQRFWQQRDGLRVFGYPLTEQISETVASRPVSSPSSQQLTVQWFERVRLEYHPELTATEPIVISLLGAELTRDRYFIAARFRAGPEIEYFPQTRHVVQAGFLKYWRANGGLYTFGYPVSDELREGDLTVQWFQRTRFEYRPEYAGTANEVQQSQLGRQVLRERGWLR